MSDMSGRLRRTQVIVIDWRNVLSVIYCIILLMKSVFTFCLVSGDQLHIEVCSLGKQRPWQRGGQLLHLPCTHLLSRFFLTSAPSRHFCLPAMLSSTYSSPHPPHCISESDENERLPEEAKSCISGTLTGLLFKSTSGAVKCLKVWLLKPNFNSFSFQFHAICSWNNISSRAEQLGSGLLPFGPLVWKSKNRCNITSRPPPLPSSSSLAMSTSSNHNHVCGGHDHDIRHGQDHSMSSATSTNLDSFSCDVI